MTEFDLIAQFFSRPIARSDVLLGVGDDAAVLAASSERRLVVAVDTIVEGVHFPAGTDPIAIGHRALAVNLSDIAAMGAEPAWFTLSLSLPSNDAAWLAGFSKGLYNLAERFNVALVGGDTVRGPLNISVQILGLVECDRWLARSGAHPGDTIFVSGLPGEAAAGLAVLQRGLQATNDDPLVNRFLWPEPRVSLGRTLRLLASSAIDVSDGLLADLGHICEKSRCAAHVDLELLPQSDAMRSRFDASECEHLSLSGGDDYELLFTVPSERLLELEAAVAASGVRCTPIGRIVEGRGVVCFRQGQVVQVQRRGFDHFA